MLHSRIALCVLVSPFLAAASLLPFADGQAITAATPLVVQPIDNAQLATLHGTVHPLAQTRCDRGPVDESSPAGRLCLMLQRPHAREAAFQQYLQAEHTPGSPNYHRWLTPARIAAQYGPADSDVQAVTQWLAASGFSMVRVSQAKRFVEFSGTVGTVNAAFHTQIHQYLVNGLMHRANATELRIPEALAPAIAAVPPICDFRASSLLQSAGSASWSAAERRIVPAFTGDSSWNPLRYALAPADFATQYDLNSLYAAGTNGDGVTIGIINESNIDLDVAAAYRGVFGLPPNPVQVIVDGADPGPNGAQTEAYLDVEMAGAVAPAATVDLYISAGSSYQDPLIDAAIRAVDDNQADILSLSFGAAEHDMGDAVNQFWNAIWEEAAAQGQTVMVASGDYGQTPDIYGFFEGLGDNPGVSGLASTPWDVAVGGTDFYYSDYATGAPSSANDWNATNDPTTKASLKATLPEQVWNDPFGLDAIANGLAGNEIYAGGGGASGCITEDSNGNCLSGYAKPSWQSGPGVPADKVRDLPDVSLFASNGANYSAYADCDYEGACAPDANGNFNAALVGGTSASAPAMAGIMALVDQKYGRQGQADATLYALARQTSTAFHDVTVGGNWDICITGDPDCTLNVDGLGADAGESTVYSAGPGYDQASGLGSIDAAQLVNNWSNITFASTSTSLRISPQSVEHGHNVTLSTTVAAANGSGTPTGAVSLLTNSTLPDSASQAAISLVSGTGSITLDDLPGGAYQLTGRYSGDSTFGSSTSSPVKLTVAPEASSLNLTITSPGSSNNTAALSYGSAFQFNAQPVGVNAPAGSTDGIATGRVVFTLDSTPITAALNSGGIAEANAPLMSVGSHTLGATYAGDASFGGSSAKPIPFSVSKGLPYVNLSPTFAIGDDGMGDTLYAGAPITASVEVGSYSGAVFGNSSAVPGTLAPTGTVTFRIVNGNSDVLGLGCQDDTTGYAQTATLSPAAGLYAQYSTAAAVFTNVAPGFYEMCAQYNGDANWQPQGVIIVNYFTVIAATTPPAPSTTTSLTITPNSISGDQFAALTATVTAAAGSSVAPTGFVSFLDNNAQPTDLNLNELTPSKTGVSASVTLYVSPAYLFTTGANQITAVYSGDTNYLPSSSAPATITIGAQPGQDFTLSPQSAQITLASGATVSSGVNITPVDNFTSNVALTCATSSSDFSCSVNPSSLSLNGTTTANITITAVKPSTTNTSRLASPLSGSYLAPRLAGTFAFCIVLYVPFRRRQWRATAAMMLLVALALVASGCGTKSTTTTTQTNPNNTPAGAYRILVTATAGTIVHNAEIAVLVTSK
ncbi:MAG TPA: Ig-like domain repeat protein [Acidobacteriaceae bacterium]